MNVQNWLAAVLAVPIIVASAGAQQRVSRADSLRLEAIVSVLQERTVEFGKGIVDECSVLKALNGNLTALNLLRLRSTTGGGIDTAAGQVRCSQPDSESKDSRQWWVEIDHVQEVEGEPVMVFITAKRGGFRFERYSLGRNQFQFFVQEICMDPLVVGTDQQELIPPRDSPARP